MNKKIKVLITTAVVLFLGLGIYTFASPNDEEDLFTETSKQNIQKVENVPTKKVDPVVEEQEIIEDEHDEQVLNVPEQNRQVQEERVQQRQDNVQNQNPVEEEVVVEVQDKAQDAYDAAEELVAKAESTLLNTDLTAALNAVNNVVDIDITILATRLDKVSNDINTRTLVENLENLVKEADSKDDITTANTYNLTEEVETKVGAVNNATLKEELTSTMTELKKVLNDTTKPLVNIVDKLNTNQDVTINVTDDTKVIIKLDNVVIENGKKVDAEGTYTLTVIDEAFNEDTITFTIDKTAPTVKIKEVVGTDGIYSYIDYKITDKVGMTKAVLNDSYTTKKEGTSRSLNFKDFGSKYVQGENTWVVYDQAGNYTTVTFIFDTVAPTVNVENEKYYNSDLTAVITEDNFDKATLNEVEYTIQNIDATTDGEYTLVMYDKAGNTSTVKFYVDKTVPVIKPRNTSVGSNNIYSVIDLQFSDNTKIVKTVTNGKEVKRTPDKGMSQYFKSYGSLYKEGKNTVELYDAAGNKTTYEFTLDLTAPEITVKEGSIGTHPIYSVINLKLHDNIGFVKAIINGTQEWEPTPNTWGDLDFASWINYKEGENTVELYDFAGNKTTYTFTLDTKPAKITKSLVYAAANGAKTTDRGYANKGNIHVRFAVDSTLSEDPIVKVGDKEVKATLVGENYYDATFTVSSLEEGKFEFTITNIKDLAKNVTNDKTTTTNNSWIIVDKTAPSIEGLDTNLTNQDVTLTITDTNLDKVTVNNDEVRLEDNKLELANEDDYIVIATDLAGNTTTKEFRIDKTAPKTKAANIYVAGDPNEQSTFYAKVGDKIVAYVRLTEELQTPVFELVSGDATVSMGEVSVSGPNANGEYTYQAIYTVNDGDLPDGEVTLKVSNVKDLANNGIVDITKPTNGHKVIIDRVQPEITNVELTKSINGKVNVELTFSETVAKAFGATINAEKFRFERANNTYNIAFEDLAGNENTYKLIVNSEALENVYKIYTTKEFTTFAKMINEGSTDFVGSTIVLENDFSLKNVEWQPLFGTASTMKDIVIDGNGHKLYNLTSLRTEKQKMNGKTVDTQYGNGFIGDLNTNVTVKNLTFVSPTITDPLGVDTTGLTSQHYAGVVVGHNDGHITIENVTITNAKIDSSWQAGGFVGYSSTDLTFKDCTIKDSYIGGVNATAGTIFGLGKVNVTVDNCHAENMTLYTDGITYESTQAKENKYYVGHLYGNKLTVTNSTEENVVIGIKTADEFIATMSAGNRLEGKILKLLNDIDLAGKAYSAVNNNGFTIDGDNHTIKNLTNVTSGSAGGFINSLGNGKKVTFKNLTLDNATIKSTYPEDAAVGGFVGMADTAGEITIINCKLTNSKIENLDGWTGGFVGYTAGWNVINDGPVYSFVTIKNSSVINNEITGAGSTASTVGHAGGNADTTTSISNIVIKNNTITGPNNRDKTGIVIGTAGVGKTVIEKITHSGNTIVVEGNIGNVLYGRYVPGSTGSLTIDGVAINN